MTRTRVTMWFDFISEDGEGDVDTAIQGAISNLPASIRNPNYEREDRFPELTIHTAVTVIDSEGKAPLPGWKPEGDDLDALRAAGIYEIVYTISDEDGMYGICLHPLVAAKIANWEANHIWTDKDGPEWDSWQRGERGLWTRLPSGVWLAIAPIDLED